MLCSEDDVFSKLEAEEQNKALHSALRRLEKTEQEIIIRYYYYNQMTKQISSETGINLETVKIKLSRSRKKLKDIFDEGGYFR